ncbi:hypothetical protein DSO57_1009770 [Entomophthora muscae]|uniref:Uncharacterized protein n=1 Tax=Entomophthora muscae TaxID=34485 RepID=A0ACC2S8S1_9FUNG|nr:hypothetical protein DSO57_1009770 [Entomophthora muscae]
MTIPSSWSLTITQDTLWGLVDKNPTLNMNHLGYILTMNHLGSNPHNDILVPQLVFIVIIQSILLVFTVDPTMNPVVPFSVPVTNSSDSFNKSKRLLALDWALASVLHLGHSATDNPHVFAVVCTHSDD